MNFTEYINSIKDVPVSDKLQYHLAVFWLHPGRLPIGVVSIGDETMPVIKIPARAVNPHGHEEKHIVPVIAVGSEAFSGKDFITDIVLPSSVGRIASGAFAGCTNLRNITIPKDIDIFWEHTFAGCDHLENIYYAGSPEEWQKIKIVHQKHEVEFGNLIAGSPVQEIISERLMHIPGNEPLFAANIHFNCRLSDISYPEFSLRTDNQDITDLFRTM